MIKIKASILRNEDPISGNKWALACEKFGIDHDIIDLTSYNWMEEIIRSRANFFLLKPPGTFQHFKTLYDERLYIIVKVLGLKTYPSYEECYVYENKKFLSYYLQAKKIPHPKTMVFYNKEEALIFVDRFSLPIVAKTSIGASGSGVQIIKSKDQSKQYIRKAFSTKGIKRLFGPNRVTGSPKKWFLKSIQNPSYFFSKLNKYFSIHGRGQRDFVIFQEYIPHEFEWRVAKIGESYFAHKKIKYLDKCSGTTGIDYVTPDENLLYFVKDLCEKNMFNFMSIDLFEDQNGGYLVNELQTIFGHVQDYILAVGDKPGRYVFLNNQWVFEPGDFNTNESYDLRLKVALELYGKQ